MIIADLKFEDNECKKLCSSEQAAQKRFGVSGAKRLKRRVKELQTSPDTPTLRQGPGDWHHLKGNTLGHLIAGDITGGDRIVVEFAPHKDGRPAWRIACIGDCYNH